MNVFRTISRALVATTVILVGSAHAIIDVSDVLRKANDNKITIAGMFAADKIFEKHFDQHGDEGKAALESFCYTLEHARESHHNIADIKFAHEMAEHFALNYGVRKVATALNHRGYHLHYVASKCDILPAGMIRDNVNPIVRTVAEQATRPEVVIAIGAVVVPIVLGMLQGGQSNK